MGGSWRTACPPPRPCGEPWPHAGLQGRPGVAVGSPCLHPLSGDSMVALVTPPTTCIKQQALKQWRCLGGGAFLFSHFGGRLCGFPCHLNCSFLRGLRLTRVLGTSLCVVPSGSYYIYGSHILKFIRHLSCYLADLPYQPTPTCQRHIPVRHRQWSCPLCDTLKKEQKSCLLRKTGS